VCDGLLHHLGRLQHERQDQLARAELVADFLHRRQQHVVEDVDRIAALERLVDLRLDPVLAPPQDRVVDARLDRCVGVLVDRRLAGGRRRSLRLEVLDDALQRVGPPVEHEIVAQLALFRPISAYGVMSAGLTIAMSRPASTQWCSITELSTCRAAGFRPNETFERPSEVSTPAARV